MTMSNAISLENLLSWKSLIKEEDQKSVGSLLERKIRKFDLCIISMRNVARRNGSSVSISMRNMAGDGATLYEVQGLFQERLGLF